MYIFKQVGVIAHLLMIVVEALVAVIEVAARRVVVVTAIKVVEGTTMVIKLD